jgi:hypothetical protein
MDEQRSLIGDLSRAIVSVNELIDPAELPEGEIDLRGAASILSIRYNGFRHAPADDCERCREITATYASIMDEDAETWVIVLRNKLALFHHVSEGDVLCDCERCSDIRWALAWASKALKTNPSE